MNSISFVRYSPHNGDNPLTAQLVECYRDVFADRPWYEWLKCPRCQKYWGIKDRGLLASYKFRHCEASLVDFWSREQVISDIYHEITPEASCWLAMDNDRVIGFCWGYPITISNLESKLGLSFGANFEYGKFNPFAYQDELGVLSAYRGQKIAKAMIVRRLDDFLAQGLNIGIVRTRQGPEPSDTFLWYTEKLGYKILTQYPDNDGRVILGRQLSGLKELLTS